MTPRNRPLLAGSLLLSLLPIALLAYMGLHTRLIHDDFGYIAIGRELGAWDTMVAYYNRWSPAYTTVYIKAALSSLGVLLPPLSIALIVGLWMLGFYLLSREVIALVGLAGRRWLIALAAAALLAAAAINAFYSPQSFYWFSSNMTYTLPLGALAGCLALGIWILNRSDNSTILFGGAAVCALIMFLTAGAAEMYVVFQFVFLAALAALAFAVVDKRQRRALGIIAAAMLLATALGLIIQVTSPGVANRTGGGCRALWPARAVAVPAADPDHAIDIRGHRPARFFRWLRLVAGVRIPYGPDDLDAGLRRYEGVAGRTPVACAIAGTCGPVGLPARHAGA